LYAAVIRDMPFSELPVKAQGTGIASQVVRALRLLQEGDFEGALVFVCVAVAASSKKEFPNLRGDGEKFRAFIDKHFELIMSATGVVPIIKGNIYVGMKHPKANTKGRCSLSQILYDVVRCTVMHEAEMPPNISFIREGFRFGKGRIDLPQSLLYGLIVAVACCQANVDLMFPPGFALTIGNERISFMEFKGDPKGAIVKIRVASLLARREAESKPSSGIEAL
jgi:hypothetical protein